METLGGFEFHTFRPVFSMLTCDITDYGFARRDN